MSEQGDCWPEQEAIWEWMKNHDITLTRKQETSLKHVVTAYRVNEGKRLQTELDEAKKLNETELVKRFINLSRKVYEETDLVVDRWREANNRAEKAETERDNWMETAALNQRNTDYYRGLVIQIGETIGKESYVADDGSISQDVLCAKVPELVIKAEAENRRLVEALEFYADKENWLGVSTSIGGNAWMANCMNDKGKQANEALKGEQEP